MRFPIETEADLPVLQTSCELSELDFKANCDDLGDTLEMAKDVAALANTNGGALIFGAATVGAALTKYVGLTHKDASAAVNAVEGAAMQRCRPSPRIASTVLPAPSAPGRFLGVVNVWAAPIAPVGVLASQSSIKVRLLDHAYIFPFRVGSHTRYLQPDQFGTLESMSARRAAALLAGIPGDERKRVTLRWVQMTTHPARPSYHSHSGTLTSVDLAKNVAVFHLSGDGGAPLKDFNCPLDWIETVWRDDGRSEWLIAYTGVIHADGGRFVARPRTPG